jgi:hypothetical protein
LIITINLLTKEKISSVNNFMLLWLKIEQHKINFIQAVKVLGIFTKNEFFLGVLRVILEKKFYEF